MPRKNLPEDDAPERPPILGSWRRMYTAVLVLHLCLVIFFYLFSNAFV